MEAGRGGGGRPAQRPGGSRLEREERGALVPEPVQELDGKRRALLSVARQQLRGLFIYLVCLIWDLGGEGGEHSAYV